MLPRVLARKNVGQQGNRLDINSFPTKVRDSDDVIPMRQLISLLSGSTWRAVTTRLGHTGFREDNRRVAPRRVSPPHR